MYHSKRKYLIVSEVFKRVYIYDASTSGDIAYHQILELPSEKDQKEEIIGMQVLNDGSIVILSENYLYVYKCKK